MSVLSRVRRVMSRVTARIGDEVEAGMATAEYAVGTVAAVAFAAVLFKVVRSQAVHNALSQIVTSALNVSL
ncbi:MAG: DUF4244 domain-containing protein [Jatrophihabitantaceae bacterium]